MSSSGRYKRQGKVYVQKAAVRVLLVVSPEEVGYWVGLFTQMTAFFKEKRHAVIDIELHVAHTAAEALGYVNADFQHPMDLVVSRLYLKMVFRQGVFDFLRAVYAGHAARIMTCQSRVAIPAVVLYDRIDNSVPETLMSTFADQIDAGAAFSIHNTTEVEGKNALVRDVVRMIAQVLDTRFIEDGNG